MGISIAPSIPAARRANKAEMAEWFGVSLPTINSWLRRGCPVVQTGNRGVSWVFDLRDVSEWRFSGSADHEETIDPENLQPADRKAWYDGEAKRIAIEREAGDLVTLDQYRDEMARVLKQVAATIETLPDILERKCSLTPETVIAMQQVLDDQRTILADRLDDA